MGYHSLVNEFVDTGKVAERVGKSRSYINNHVRFIQLDEELRNFLADGKISAGHAKVLLGGSDQKTRIALGQDIVRNGWSVRKCEEEINDYLIAQIARFRKGVPIILSMLQWQREHLQSSIEKSKFSQNLLEMEASLSPLKVSLT